MDGSPGGWPKDVEGKGYSPRHYRGGSPARKVPAAIGFPEFSPQPLFALTLRLV